VSLVGVVLPINKKLVYLVIVIKDGAKTGRGLMCLRIKDIKRQIVLFDHSSS